MIVSIPEPQKENTTCSGPPAKSWRHSALNPGLILAFARGPAFSDDLCLSLFLSILVHTRSLKEMSEEENDQESNRDFGKMAKTNDLQATPGGIV